MELARLEKEVEALRLVAPLLSEDKEGTDPAKNGFGMGTAQQPIRIPQAAVAATASPAQPLVPRAGKKPPSGGPKLSG